MSKEKIKLLIIAVSGIFVLLAAGIFINYYLDQKNIILKMNIAKNSVPPKNTTTATSSTPTIPPGPVVNNDDLNKTKLLIIKDIDNIQKTVSSGIAGNYKNIAACVSLKSQSEKDICISLWAEHEKNPGFCSQTSIAGRQYCQDISLSAQASSDKNISLCAKIGNAYQARSCIMGVVKSAHLSQKDCAPLSADENKFCLAEILSMEAASIKDCDNITDAVQKQYCRDNFSATFGKK